MAGRTPSDVDARVGARLKAARTAANLSQRQVAEAIGVTGFQFQKYEQGTNRTTAEVLQICARVLGVPVADLFDPEPERPPREFADGQAVWKVGGRYQGPGEIRGAAWMSDGSWLYVVEMQVAGGEGRFARVLPASKLRARSERLAPTMPEDGTCPAALGAVMSGSPDHGG